MNDQQLQESISDTISALDNKVHDLATASQGRYRMLVEAGATMPAFGEYEPADDEGREAIRDAAREAYEDIMEDVDAALAGARRAMSEPAKADDAATVGLALGRVSVTETELQALLDRYASNYQLAAAICERAHREGFYLDGEPEPVRIFREDASRAAARVLDRYNRAAVIVGPEDFAGDVVRALRHIDVMGRQY